MIGKAIAGTAGLGGAYLGLSEAGSFLSDPRDYIKSRGKTGIGIYENAGTAATIAGGTLALGGATAMSAGHIARASIMAGKGLGKGIPMATSPVSGAINRTIGGAVNATGKAWDRYGAMGTLGAAAKMGVMYGGLSTGMSLSMDRYVSDDAMAQSQQGGVYEGNDGFGNRSPSTVRTMGSSTMGLTQGLHNRR